MFSQSEFLLGPSVLDMYKHKSTFSILYLKIICVYETKDRLHYSGWLVGCLNLTVVGAREGLVTGGRIQCSTVNRTLGVSTC